LQVDPAYSPDELLQAAESAIEVFERLGDDAGVAAAMSRAAAAHWGRCRMATTEEVLERALVHASNAGDRRQTLEILEVLGRALVIGPRPVEEGARRCRDILELARDEPRLDAWTRSMLAVLEAMRGREDEARRLYQDSQRGLAALGLILPLSGARMYAGVAELVLGNPAAAEREFRDGCSMLEEIGERGTLSTMTAFLARALAVQGHYQEVEQLTVASERAASESDLASQVLWRGARARALAHRGEFDAAERLAREAVSMSEAADFTNTRADLLVDLADVLGEMRPIDADDALSRALLLYEAKGNIAAASRLRDSLRRSLPTGRAEP
jgi:tetratricopeptide (TPR) repeat protein